MSLSITLNNVIVASSSEMLRRNLNMTNLKKVSKNSIHLPSVTNEETCYNLAQRIASKYRGCIVTVWGINEETNSNEVIERLHYQKD